MLAVFFLAFAGANLASWRQTGRPAGLGVTLLEAWVGVLFLCRRPAGAVSVSWAAWLAAPLGTFTMLLARPGPPPGAAVYALAETVQVAGVTIAFLSLGTLGRSFGLVAANRGIKSTGPYRLVRHPAYLGYLTSWAGYVIESPTARNVALLVLAAGFQLVRIHHEELLLRADQTYRRYCSDVPFRLIPHVY